MVAMSSNAPLQQAVVQPQISLPAATASLDHQLSDKIPSNSLSVEYPATDDSRSLLPLICEEHNIVENHCKQAKNYPGGKACAVELQPTRFEGRFLSANSSTIVVEYLSDCEPHAQNWGGSLAFEKHDRVLTFIGYLPGFVVTGCTPITKGAGRENLICTTAFMGQGHLETTVGEVEFTQNTKGVLKVSYDRLSDIVTDSTNAWGANRVDCNADLQLFNLDSPKSGPEPDTAIVEASYADAATIRKACAPDAEQQKIEALMPPPPGQAYIDERDTKSGQFVVDLRTRKIVPMSDFRRR